jgi:hypothetical protein
MSAGLFALPCPQCNGELEIDRRGMGTCATCNRAYLTRFGYLIPLDQRDLPFAPADDSSRFGPGDVTRGDA